MNRDDVIEILEEMGQLLDLAGENSFKVRAYENAARALAGVEVPLASAIADGTLRQIKGIGPGLFADIKALVEKGELEAYDTLKAKTPPGLLDMLAIPGLGPKKVRAIHEGLGITTVGELEYACLENRLCDLAGFGEKTQIKVLASIAAWKSNKGKRLLGDVMDAAAELGLKLAAHEGIAQCAETGSLRRRDEIQERLEWIVTGPAAANALSAFAGLGEVLDRGGESCLVRLALGLEGLATYAAPEVFGAALAVTTGDEAFTNSLEAHATARGYTLGRDGLRQGATWVPTPDEATVFAALGLAAIPPEQRWGTAIVAAAAAGPIPASVVDADIQGVMHLHTTASDGQASLRAMVAAAQERGYRYLGVTDHSEAAFYARGLRREQIAAQRAEIDALNAELTDFTVFAGIEADILADGSLDYDDETLAAFDFVVGSVHSRFGQDREAMTNRLTRAVQNPHLTILGHPTGRLLLSREPYDCDMEAVLRAAAAAGKVVELNANPHRLDLDWRMLGLAQELGLPVAINPDAHSIKGLDDTRYGVAMARKAGLPAASVYNARPLADILADLAARRQAARVG